jgi:acetyltransferase-like isoleucine patch superfamily enzyme
MPFQGKAVAEYFRDADHTFTSECARARLQELVLGWIKALELAAIEWCLNDDVRQEQDLQGRQGPLARPCASERAGSDVGQGTRTAIGAHISGGGNIAVGEGTALVGTVVPIEFISPRGANLRIGKHSFINYGTSISAHELVSIGRHCLLGHYTFILDNNQHDLRQHHVLPPSAPVVIDHCVWIGARVVILPGVHIGHHAAIGAGSVVATSIPPYSLAVGNPARVSRRMG